MYEFYYTTRVQDFTADEDILEVLATKRINLLFSAASNLTKRGITPVPILTENGIGLAADPGGFIATHKFGGVYPFSNQEYFDWLTGFKPDWAGIPDLSCVAFVGQGKQRKVVEPDPAMVQLRQDQTTAWVEEYIARWPQTPWAWVPTIQGYTIEQYRRHARALAPFISHLYWHYWEMCQIEEDDGEIDAANTRFEAFRVGIGGLVGRDKPGFVREILLAIKEEIGEYIPLHAWGLKLRYLKACQLLAGRYSFDTSCFDERYSEKDRQAQKASEDTQVEYRWKVAQPDYDTRVQRVLSSPQQSLLFPQTFHPLQYKKMLEHLTNQ
jgi:hypothetical protein